MLRIAQRPLRVILGPHHLRVADCTSGRVSIDDAFGYLGLRKEEPAPPGCCELGVGATEVLADGRQSINTARSTRVPRSSVEPELCNFRDRAREIRSWPSVVMSWVMSSLATARFECAR